MVKYQGPVFHKRLQSERNVKTTSPHEVRKQQNQSHKNDIPFYREHESKPFDEPKLTSKTLTHKVTPYQEDRSSTPFKVKQVPSPFYGTNKRQEEKKEKINYAIIYQNLTKQNEDLLLFDDYLSELGEEHLAIKEEASTQNLVTEEQDIQENEEQMGISPPEPVVDSSIDATQEVIVPPISEEQVEENLNQVNSEILDSPEETNEILVQEANTLDTLPKETDTTVISEINQEEVSEVVKEPKKRGLTRSLAGMIQEEQDVQLNKGRDIARYFGETNLEPETQPATISELLNRAKSEGRSEELEALLEDSTPTSEKSVVEEDEVASEETTAIETNHQIEAVETEIETETYPATITELLAKANQGQQSEELEKLMEESTPLLEEVSAEEILNNTEEPVVIEVPDVEDIELETQPATITELLARANSGDHSTELEALIGESTPIIEEDVQEEVVVLEEPNETIIISPREVNEELTEELDVEIVEASSEDFEEADVSGVDEDEEATQYVEDTDTEEWKPVEESYATEKEALLYQFPSLDLLKEPVTFEPNIIDDWVLEQAEILNESLEAFNIEAQVVGWTIGPAITQFELQLGRGVKVNKITNLSDDLKLSLAAKDIRIEAPIPGKNTVGVEIPNKKSRPVMISEVIGSENFKNSKSPLTIAMGVNLAGEAVVSRIDKMPHGLIAGATGSGKSVFINSLLVSLLYKATPNDVKLILIDPKAVELAPYNGLPHLLSPVISEPKAANEALKWAVIEMEDRYQKLAAGGVRNIDHFNKKVEAHGDHALKMPYIVIIIDELADLMMVASSEVQDSIARITQKARAAGIHLIVATQRPSVDVVTGTIKNNIPTRIAFMVSSQVDSRTIIDTGGAEKLLGRGDMLFQANGVSQPTRIQGTYVEEEIDGIVDFVKQQQEPNYLFQSESLLAKAEALEGKDDLFDEVLPFIVDEGTVSASSLQRKFKIGFNRASNLIDTLESESIISENKGSRPRDVFLTRNDYEEKFL